MPHVRPLRRFELLEALFPTRRNLAHLERQHGGRFQSSPLWRKLHGDDLPHLYPQQAKARLIRLFEQFLESGDPDTRKWIAQTLLEFEARRQLVAHDFENRLGRSTIRLIQKYIAEAHKPPTRTAGKPAASVRKEKEQTECAATR